MKLKKVEFRIVYGEFYGLEAILSQISVQDAARLLNELEYRIDQLVKVKTNQFIKTRNLGTRNFRYRT